MSSMNMATAKILEGDPPGPDLFSTSASKYAHIVRSIGKCSLFLHPRGQYARGIPSSRGDAPHSSSRGFHQG